MAEIVGNKNGIKLWSLMYHSTNESEIKYVKQLNESATKYSRVWFSDLLTTMATKRNQAVYQMRWDGNNWVIDLFLLPEGAKEITDRLK